MSLTVEPRPAELRGITRNEKNKCWLARITRRRWKYSEYFWDSRCGGRDEALKQAQEWYAKMKAKLPEPVSRLDRFSSRNRSGVVGVYRAIDVVKRMGGVRYYHWVGTWDPKIAGKKFSIKKYGEDQAFVLACVARSLRSRDDEAIWAEYERWSRDGRALEMLKQKRGGATVDESDVERARMALTA